MFIAHEGHTTIRGAGTLRREFDRLVQREMIRRPETITTSIVTNGIKDEPPEEEDSMMKLEGSYDNVLTLLGGSQPPKQLFTSRQQPNASFRQRLDASVLPNGISTTKVVPQHSLNEDGKQPVVKLKVVFPPPPSLAPLSVPKQSRHTATRSSSVNWYNPNETEARTKPSRHDGFTKQGLSTGQWLKYSVAPNPTQLASPETKRKQRDRALSAGEPQTALSQEAIESHHQAKEDALFRSVYSSFAPTRDDYGALVSEPQKNRIWWRKYGEGKYKDLLGSRDDGIDIEEDLLDGMPDEYPLDEVDLETTLANWKSDDTPQDMESPSTSKGRKADTDKEAGDLLEEISSLLETLHSHQRIRNLTLPNNPRAVSGQNTQTAELATSPTIPSTAEFDVYEMLKNQLTLIISTLPPYLLSKLDGDKLGALKVITNVPVDTTNQKGVLEESEASAIARRSATPSATPAAASQSTNPYAGLPGRSTTYMQTSTPAQQYPRAGYGPSSTSRPNANSTYLQNPQYSNRPAPASYASSTARLSYPAQPGYPSQAATASTPRYNYAQQFSQQSSQGSYGSYPNGYRAYNGQNATSYNYNGQVSAPQARGPSTPAQTPQAYRGTAAEYQQRAVPPQGYGYGSAQAGGSASPQTQQRPALSGQTPSASAQQRPPLYHQSSSQYQARTPGSPLVNGNVSTGSPAPPGHMNAEEQAASISQQKALLAERQSRQGSGTPQPGSRQYTPQQDSTQENTVQQNGTPAPQQNGIVAGPA